MCFYGVLGVVGRMGEGGVWGAGGVKEGVAGGKRVVELWDVVWCIVMTISHLPRPQIVLAQKVPVPLPNLDRLHIRFRNSKCTSKKNEIVKLPLKKLSNDLRSENEFF